MKLTKGFLGVSYFVHSFSLPILPSPSLSYTLGRKFENIYYELKKPSELVGKDSSSRYSGGKGKLLNLCL